MIAAGMLVLAGCADEPSSGGGGGGATTGDSAAGLDAGQTGDTSEKPEDSGQKQDPSDAKVSQDTGAHPLDAGTTNDVSPPLDSGAVATDAGASLQDTATGPLDTATGPQDTTAAPEDAAQTPQDSGTTASDATTSAPDSGPSVEDSAPTPQDAGPPPAFDIIAPTPDATPSPDAGKPPPNGNAKGEHLRVWLSSPLIENADNKGAVTIQCHHVDKDGKQLADPGDLQLSSSAADAKQGGDVWSFPTSGQHTVTCTSKTLGWTATRPIVVARKGVDPALARLSVHGAKSAALLDDIIALGKQGKKTEQGKALEAFDKAGKEMIGGFVGGTQILLPLPKELPPLQKLKDKGLQPGPDDTKWTAAVDSASSALKKMQAAIAAVDPKSPSAAALATLQAAQSELDKSVAELHGLKPSALAVYGALAKVEALVGAELAKTMTAHHGMLSKALHHLQKTAPPPPCPNCFSLVGTMVSIGIQYTLASMPSYTGLLKDMGWAIGEMALTLVIKDVVDDQFPPQAGGPSIDAIAALGASAVTPGVELKVLASNMGSQPGECGVVFVTPVVSKTIIDTVKLIMGGIPSLKDLKKKGAWEAAKAIKSALDQLKSFIELGKDAIPNLAENGVLIMGSQSGSAFTNPMIIKLGVVPKKANCGWLPKPGILIPYCRSTGRGPSFSVTVIGKNC